MHFIQEDNRFYTDENLDDLLSSENFGKLNESKDLFATSDKGELLRYHYRFGHMSENKLHAMAREGLIPKKFSKVKLPRCAACMFGKLTKRPKRTKGEAKYIYPTTKPGQCVSVDQLESSTAGFLGQVKGRLTRRRYKYATIFVDPFFKLYLKYSFTVIHNFGRNNNCKTCF